MNQKEFGKLVAALRQDLDWTQAQLAEYSDLDQIVIGQIEQGIKKNIEPGLLVKLANALQLRTIERKEFLYAGSGIGVEHILRKPSAGLNSDAVNSDKVLERMIGLVEQMRVPSFLVDVYSDVLAANRIAFAFFQVPPGMLANAASIPGGFNTIRMVFGKDLAMRAHFKADWDEYAMRSMSSFREQTLRFRARPYFNYLLKAFRNPVDYPFFDRYWRAVSSVETDQEGNFQYFNYEHDTFGRLEYVAATIVTTTRDDELILVHNLPMNENTRVVFDRLAIEHGQGVVRLAPWPVKSMP